MIYKTDNFIKFIKKYNWSNLHSNLKIEWIKIHEQHVQKIYSTFTLYSYVIILLVLNTVIIFNIRPINISLREQNVYIYILFYKGIHKASCIQTQ